MKFKIAAVFAAVAGFGAVLPVQAKISDAAFHSSETVTAGKVFLNQVDTVSLYLSTERIVYVPRFTKERRLSVGLTLVGASFDSDRARMQKFVTRHINAFNKALQERLEFHVPQLAKEFHPKEDVDFVIKVGAEQKTVATWQGGKWKWVDPSFVPVSKISQKLAPVAQRENVKKRCPALVGAKRGLVRQETP